MDLLQRCLPHHVSSCHAPHHLQTVLRGSLHNVVNQASMSADQLLQTCWGNSGSPALSTVSCACAVEPPSNAPKLSGLMHENTRGVVL